MHDKPLPAIPEKGPVRQLPFVVWALAGTLLYLGLSNWWDYWHEGFIKVYTKDTHGGYLEYDGLLAVMVYSVWLATGAYLLLLCLRRYWSSKKP